METRNGKGNRGDGNEKSIIEETTKRRFRPRDAIVQPTTKKASLKKFEGGKHGKKGTEGSQKKRKRKRILCEKTNIVEKEQKNMCRVRTFPGRTRVVLVINLKNSEKENGKGRAGGGFW